MGSASAIAIRIVLTIHPAGFKLATSAGALLVHRATHRTANVAQQGYTTSWLLTGAEHGDPVRSDQFDLMIRHNPTGGLALAPKERHTKVRTARTAIEARTDIGHGGRILREPASGTAAILGIATPLGSPAEKDISALNQWSGKCCGRAPLALPQAPCNPKLI